MNDMKEVFVVLSFESRNHTFVTMSKKKISSTTLVLEEDGWFHNQPWNMHQAGTDPAGDVALRGPQSPTSR